MEQKKKTSMSVAEMRSLLGLGKTESYWLIKKNYFKVITVNGKMRVMIDSFEDWYSQQFHYKKVDGSAPGSKWSEITLSAAELAIELGICEDVAYTLIRNGYFDTVLVGQARRITRDSFENWYRDQNVYRKVSERYLDAELLEKTISMPEAARLLGWSRNAFYYYVQKGCFDTVVIGRQKRITKESFREWLLQRQMREKEEIGRKELI